MSMLRRSAFLLGVSFVLVACQGSGDTSAPGDPTGAADQALTTPSPAAAQPRAERRGDAHRDRARRGHRMGPPGPEHLIDLALRDLDLGAAQRSAIEAARPTDGARPAPRRGPPEAVTKALAAAVRAGSVDAAAIAAEAGGEPAALAEHRAAVASALGTLHAALTKEQRRQLVGAAAKELEDHAPKGPPPFARPEHDRGGPLGHLLEGLDLTDAQRASIDAALATARPSPPDEADGRARFEALRAELRARLDAFVSDRFDARAFVEPPAGAPGPRGHLDRMAKDLAAVVAVLDPAQREALAAKIEQGPPARGRHAPPPDLDEPAPEGAAR